MTLRDSLRDACTTEPADGESLGVRLYRKSSFRGRPPKCQGREAVVFGTESECLRRERGEHGEEKYEDETGRVQDAQI